MAENNNRIEVQDVVDKQPLLDALNEIKGSLEGLKNEIQEVTKGQKIELKNIISTAGMEKAIEKVYVLVQALAALGAAYQQNQNAINAVTTAQVRQSVADKNSAEAKLAAARASREANKETERSSRIAEREIKEQEAVANVHKLLTGELNTEQMSYNQLYEVYKKMSAELKSMSAETINATVENRNFAAITKSVRDAMNESMKAMGNYSLNVGKYHTAFDGLGYSILQVLREVPSAINISQFFLAISNNIPMVVDQMKAFNEEQENLKKQLGDLQEGTKEYMELQQKQMSLGQKVLKSIFSWQTALLGVLLLLRKLPDILKGLGDKIENFFLRSSQYLMSLKQVNAGAASTVGELRAKYEGLRKEFAELSDDNRADWVKRHADDWKDLGIKVGDVKTAEDVYVNNTSMVLDAINKRARAIAAMKIATEKYEEAFKLRSKAELTKAQARETTLPKYSNSVFRSLGSPSSMTGGTVTYEQLVALNNARLGKEYDKAIKDAEKLEKEARYYIENWRNDDSYNTGGGGSKKNPTLNEIKSRYWDRQKAYLDVLEDGFEKEIALAKVAHEQASEENKSTYEEQLILLEENWENRLITEKEYNNTRTELKKDYSAINLSIDAAYEKQSHDIWEKYEKIRIEAEIEATNVTLTEYRKRVRTKTDELNNNKQVNENIAKLEMKLAKLRAVDTKGIVEEEKKKQKEIDETTKAIERQKNAFKFDHQLKNYKNFWDMVGANGALEGMGGNDKKGFLQRLGIVGVNDDNAESVFDMWVTNASAALKDMGDELKSYLGDMLDTWASFYESQAELAAQNTESAKSYWEDQKKLAEEGYANEVDTAWAAYQEKKRQQQEAEQMAMQWASVSQYLSDIESGANLAVAVSNLLKQFTAIPGVGLPLAVGAVASLMKMWGTYKSQIKSVATYGEGGYEALVGGSHASGHDIDMGFPNRAGKRVHTEGGEGWAVFSRRAVRKYSHRGLGELVNSANAGTLALNALNGVERGMNVNIGRAEVVSLERVEQLLGAIEKNGSTQTYVMADGTMVVKNGSSTKKIRR